MPGSHITAGEPASPPAEPPYLERPLQTWLGELSLGEFRARHLRRAPLAHPHMACEAVAACDWQVLGRLLAAGPPDVLVVARGKLLDVRAPRSLAELRALFACGAGIAVRRPEACCPEIAALCDAFARELPGEQRVIVFATPAGTHGFGWHYDAEDVFIVQTGGDKSYYFRRNTVDPEPERAARYDFGAITLERTPVLECRLIAGDFLYLPRGYWHVARAHAASLSLSIGVFPS